MEEPLPWVLGNEAALTQCCSNLLSNAVKFVAPGVSPRVRVWGESLPGCAGAPDRVRVWFADNGIGIAPELHGHVFKLFHRLESDYDGTGVGLAVVRKAVEKMGGKVGFESEAGKGSRFWLELAAASAASTG